MPGADSCPFVCPLLSGQLLAWVLLVQCRGASGCSLFWTYQFCGVSACPLTTTLTQLLQEAAILRLCGKRQAFAYTHLGKTPALFFSWHAVLKVTVEAGVDKKDFKEGRIHEVLDILVKFKGAAIVVASIDQNFDEESRALLKFLALASGAKVISPALREYIVCCLHCMFRQQ